MPTNGTRHPVLRRPRSLLDFDDLRDFLALDTRWPFAARTLHEESLVPVDVFERDGNVIVEAEMPGIAPDKIEVTVEAGELRISGEREEEHEVKEEHYYRNERSFGRVYRAVTLPENCDTGHITATTKDGVIEVTVPRKAAAATHKIEVKKA